MSRTCGASEGWYERFGQPETAPDPGDRLGLRSLAIPGPDVLVSYAQAVDARTARFLGSLQDARLADYMGGLEQQETVSDSLRHVIVHKNNHHGQIDYPARAAGRGLGPDARHRAATARSVHVVR